MKIKNLLLISIALFVLFVNYIIVCSFIRFVDCNVLFVFYCIFYFLFFALLLRFKELKNFVFVLLFVFLSFNLAIVVAYLFRSLSFGYGLDLFVHDVVGHFSSFENILLSFFISGVWFFGIIVFYIIYFLFGEIYVSKKK